MRLLYICSNNSCLFGLPLSRLWLIQDWPGSDEVWEAVWQKTKLPCLYRRTDSAMNWGKSKAFHYSNFQRYNRKSNPCEKSIYKASLARTSALVNCPLCVPNLSIIHMWIVRIESNRSTKSLSLSQKKLWNHYKFQAVHFLYN